MDLSSTLKPIPALSLLLLYGCGDDSEEPAPMNCSSSNLQAAVSNIAETSCGQENGSFELSISGGVTPLEFNLAGTGFQAIQPGTTAIEGVPSGNHTLTVRDANDCTFSTNVNVPNTNNVAIDAEIQPAGCESANGTIMVTASGGNEPYSYGLDGSAPQPGNAFAGLTPGDYTVLVTDDDGCQTSETVNVLSGISYNNDISPILQANCIKSACHDGSNGSAPNWSILANVQDRAQAIKTRTTEGSMPPAGNDPLEAEEVQAIACWVDDGAPDN